MPTWWVVGVAVYVPLFLWTVVHGVRSGEDDAWTAVWATTLFFGVSTASAFFWFG